MFVGKKLFSNCNHILLLMWGKIDVNIGLFLECSNLELCQFLQLKFLFASN